MIAKKTNRARQQLPIKTLGLPDTELGQMVSSQPCGSSEITPLELMLKIMHELYAQAESCSAANNQNKDLFGNIDSADSKETRIKLLNMAAAVGRHIAPYIHPRLSAIEHTGKDGAPLQSGVLLVPSILSLEEWEYVARPSNNID
jgi:hypothetical protein